MEKWDDKVYLKIKGERYKKYYNKNIITYFYSFTK